MSTRWKPQKPTHTHTHTHTDSFLKSLKQIGTICFAIFCLVFPNFSYGACTDGAYRACEVSGSLQSQKCSSNSWINVEDKNVDEWPYICGDRSIPESTNGGKVWNDKAWIRKTNEYVYWKTPYKSLSSDGCAEFNDICVGCARDEYYDTEEDKCKKSVYAPPCDTTQSAGQSCTFNDGAASAICKDIGFKSNDESVLTCVAQTCKEGYLLKLSTKRNGKSDGRCYTIERANETCPAKPNDCNGEWGLKLYLNPNTQEADKAYKSGDCECKTQSSSVKDISADTYCEQNNVSKNAGADKTSASGTNWSVVFDYGTMTGKSLCHTSGSGKIAKGTTSSNGNYCWCALQDEADWVFLEQISNNCSGTCAKKCADKVASDKGFRESVFYCPVKRCITEIWQKLKIGGDSSNQWLEVLLQSGEYVKLSSEQALSFSQNWDYKNLKAYSHRDNEIQEYEKDACDVIARVNAFITSKTKGAKVSEQPKVSAADDAKKKEIENAKQVLSGFFASASANRNVWKNEEGKFNTARLASDLGAAVVLGTVGGVVSGTVIKKKQIKKGFESLQCYIGGRAMAGWGDTFNVDLAR